MNSDEEFTEDDAEIAELLRSSGVREQPPPAAIREVEAVVRAEWQQAVAARQRRRTTWWAAAAAVCALAIGSVVTVELLDDTGQPIATLQRAEGEVFVGPDGDHWKPLATGERVSVGDFVRADGRVALNLDNGLSVRADRDTAFRLSATDRWVLSSGALYVDATPDSASSFIVETHVGTIRHLGTQYLVRTRVDGIDVSVREGRIVVANDYGENVAIAGERLDVKNNGDVQRANVAANDAVWQWASEVAPAFAIDNQSLATFLSWLARETGRTLTYGSPQAQSAAADVMLRGSIEGLTPDVALTSVLATTPLQLEVSSDASIRIGLAIDSSQPSRPIP